MPLRLTAAFGGKQGREIQGERIMKAPPTPEGTGPTRQAEGVPTQVLLLDPLSLELKVGFALRGLFMLLPRGQGAVVGAGSRGSTVPGSLPACLHPQPSQSRRHCGNASHMPLVHLHLIQHNELPGPLMSGPAGL